MMGPVTSGIRLIASDVDGTLLTPDHRITPAVRAAVRRATDAGVTVVLASARGPEAFRHIVAELGLPPFAESPSDDPLAGAFVSFQGAVVGHFLADGSLDVLHETRLDLEAAREIVRTVVAAGHVANWYDGAAWLPSRWDELGELEARATAVEPAGFIGDAQLVDAGARAPHKLMVPPCAWDPELVPRIAANLPEGCEGFLSGEHYLEIVASGVDKSSGLVQLAADLGVGPEAMAAVGDGPNDLGMFAHVGTAVAMANASDAVKAAATWVTASNREDGLALAIDRLLG